ncbi:MAG: hypothetical protein M1830_007221 [Pleopsidium flavum]|nr:MAG: hypothetical protein M1830_007221 [Pleopsidium flavum]
MMKSAKLNSAVDKVKKALRKIAGMPGKLKVYGKKGGALVSEAFSKLSNTPKKDEPNDRSRSPLKSKTENAKTRDEEIQGMWDSVAEFGCERRTRSQTERSVERYIRKLREAPPKIRADNSSKNEKRTSFDLKLQRFRDLSDQYEIELKNSTLFPDENAIESNTNLSKAAPVTRKSNARNLTRVRDQPSTAGPTGSSLDGILDEQHTRLAELQLDPSTRTHDEDAIESYGDSTETARVTRKGKARQLRSELDQVSTASPAASSIAPEETPETLEYLKPLLAVAEGRLDDKQICNFNAWADRLSEHYEVVKMGEGAFGEIYRLKRRSEHPTLQVLEETVFKIIPLRARNGIGSRTGIRINEAVSEIELLTKMTPVPGFTRFHEAFIIRGTPPPQIVKARPMYRRSPKASQTDRPQTKRYPVSQLWVVMEMQYAGSDLEDTLVSSNWQTWDLFWGVAIALARAEQYARFEHRDLHLGNICVKAGRPDGTIDGPLEVTKKEVEDVKLGFSGLVVTLIDYTLSRADITPDHVAFYDLEKAEGFFDQHGDVQYEIYRHMRAEVCLGDPMSSYAEIEAGIKKAVGGWRGFHPRTNLLWLYYLRKLMLRSPAPESVKKRTAAGKRAQQLCDLLGERLDSIFEKLAPENMSQCELSSAGDLVEYAISKGWLNDGDLTG